MQNLHRKIITINRFIRAGFDPECTCRQSSDGRPAGRVALVDLGQLLHQLRIIGDHADPHNHADHERPLENARPRPEVNEAQPLRYDRRLACCRRRLWRECHHVSRVEADGAETRVRFWAGQSGQTGCVELVRLPVQRFHRRLRQLWTTDVNC